VAHRNVAARVGMLVVMPLMLLVVHRSQRIPLRPVL